ncbi:hypothetical protein, partial [Mesorhizobium sp. IMUNJ 23232]|uniref:hypothetical protein n=1 Tax=Mesorhizobium sp. IMUNJ 23232 TaxID=3376064 RepID=UPI00378E5760
MDEHSVSRIIILGLFTFLLTNAMIPAACVRRRAALDESGPIETNREALKRILVMLVGMAEM